MIEVVTVVAAVAADGQCNRQWVAATAGAAHALLVVLALWWHVGQQHCTQRADVDAGLHCRGHRQYVDAASIRRLLVEEDLLEVGLPALREITTGLRGELLYVDARGRLISGGEF